MRHRAVPKKDKDWVETLFPCSLALAVVISSLCAVPRRGRRGAWVMRPITILIVDDEDSIRALVQATLEGPECHVLMASTGQQAWDVVHSVPPDAIVLDWMMPGMNGIDFLQSLS